MLNNVSGANQAILNSLQQSATFKTAAKTFEEGETLQLVSSASGNIELRDTSGDVYSLSSNNIKDYGLTDEQFAALQGTDSTDAATASNAATAATGSGSASELKAELEKLQQEKEDNKEMMTQLEDKIEDLEKKVRESIEDATKAMEKTEEQHKTAVETAVQGQLAQYKADKQNGKDVTPETLKANVNKAVTDAGAPNFAKSISEMMSADTNIKLMDNLLGVLNNHIQTDKELDTKIGQTETAYQAAEAAEQASKKSCDPIGFQTTDKNGEAVQFDFFVDRDGDNKITDESEFLGATADANGEDGWSEMSALNKDGNNVIDADELAAGNVKVMVTKADGSQQAMSIAEMEAQYGEIEINSTKDAQTKSGVGPNDFNNSKYDNKLLGSFGLTIGGKEVTGYQTADDIEYLKDNYEFSGTVGNLQKTAAGKTGETEATDDEKFYDRYMQEVMPELKAALQETQKSLGLSQDLLKLIDEVSSDSAEVQATQFTKEIDDKQAAKKAEREEAQESEDDNLFVANIDKQIESGEEISDEDASKYEEITGTLLPRTQQAA